MRWTSKPSDHTASAASRFSLLRRSALSALLCAALLPAARAQQPAATGATKPAAAPTPVKPAAPAKPASTAQSKPAIAATGATGPAKPAAAGPVATQPRRVSLPPPPPHNLILIDPAHGGSETGALLSQHLAEKDVTLALAARLRSTLQSHGFNVLTTRDSDAALTTLQRAEMANHAAPIACLILHATAAGNGVHVFTSALAPVARRGAVLPWSTAQAAFAQQSADLALQIHTALAHSHFPVIQLQTSLAPLDNLTCPAVAVEIAPALGEDASTTLDPGNAGYQQQVVESLATALVNWRGQAGVTP